MLKSKVFVFQMQDNRICRQKVLLKVCGKNARGKIAIGKNVRGKIAIGKNVRAKVVKIT